MPGPTMHPNIAAREIAQGRTDLNQLLRWTSFGNIRSWMPLVLVVAALVIGYTRAVSHLQEPLWQDEAATMLFHVTKFPWEALVRYESANSHMGFSAMMSAWIAVHIGSMDVPALRALPLALSLGAIPVTFLAARRLNGPWTGAIAALLLAQSAVFENFATQLRGYGPSWFFMAFALLSALSIFEEGRRFWWRFLYATSALASISILPTNAFFLGAMSLCVALQNRPSRPYRLERMGSLAFLLAVPPICLVLAYAAVLPELMRYSEIAFSEWSRWDLLTNWIRGTLGDERLLIPFVLAGVLAQAVMTLRTSEAGGSSRPIQLAAVLLSVLPLAIFLMPNPPFPRTLTPYLPIWYAAIACTLSSAAEALARGVGRSAALAGLLLGGLGLLTIGPMPTCRGAPGSGAHSYDLCYQYFRDDYKPQAVLDVWASLGKPDLPIVGEFEAFFAIGVLGTPTDVIHAWAFRRDEHPDPLIVAYDDDGARELLDRIRSRTRYRLVADTGYFNVYAPAR